MTLQRTGYVGLFEEPLEREKIREIVLSWMERFGRVEQTLGGGAQVLTQSLSSADALSWEQSLQFRVLSGEQFAWIYVSLAARVMETSGLVGAGATPLCRDVLDGLPGCLEIIDDRDDRRLDRLEAQGLM